MTHDQVKAYVDQQVREFNDLNVKPLVQSINGELAKQRGFNDQKAELDKQIADSQTRIAAFQKYIGEAQTQSNELATKLAEATAAAVTSGQE
jgi:hypothetical protein